MDDCSCGKFNSNPLKEGMTVTDPWKSKDSAIPGINQSNLQREEKFFRNNYYF